MTKRSARHCDEVQESLQRGEILSGAEDHLLGCEACAALALRGLSPEQAAPPTELDALLTGIEREIDRERGLPAWLKTRSTAVRWWLAIGVSAGIVGTFAAVASSSVVHAGRAFSLDLVFAVAFIAVLSEVLRPSYRRDRRSSLLPLALGMLAVPTLVALGVHAWPGAGAIDDSPDHCFGFGLPLAAAVFGLLRGLDRRTDEAWGSGLLAAGAAALVANLALTFYCSSADLNHLMFSHAPVGVVLCALYLVIRRVKRGLGGRSAA